MTIDELFDMPICDMKAWMTNNFKDSTPQLLENYYYYFNIKDTFGLDFPKDSGWRIIPVRSDVSIHDVTRKGVSALEYLKRESYSSQFYEFAVAKISKYGECLVYRFSGKFYTESSNIRFVLEKIEYNLDNKNCRCYIDGPDVVNNSVLSVPYKYVDGTDNWINRYKFLDSYVSVEYNVKPKVGGLNKNKHSINEYNKKLEEFAKKVKEVGEKAYIENNSIISDSGFIEKCKIVHLTPQEVFDLWLALYIENQTITFDDTIGILRLAESKENLISEYRDKYKCRAIEKQAWSNKWTLKESSYYGLYSICLLFGREDFTQTSGFSEYLKHLDETRKLYRSIDTYKDTVTKSKEEYRKKFKVIAKKWEKCIEGVYTEAMSKLKPLRDAYLKETKALYNEIHTTYPGVNDSDVGVFDDIPEILDKISGSFEKTALELMRQLTPGYKKKKSNTKNTNIFSQEFMDHCKLMFDVSEEIKKLPYYEVYKCEDGPYETGERMDDLFDRGFDDYIFLYEEKYGQDSFEKWLKEFYNLAPYDKTWQDSGNDLYPGQRLMYYITRDFKDVSEEECY